ncbi:GNAT family N-acetyltransferase [Sporosarcina koreensis]|uniref:GNAT family N-acetyltransferase n=1 Tax=Sporosarcina koreensis TaxID=334735 RepID=UPI00075597F3|nr:GNAT family N-acetyltransferase [Sporosarcina koreensis]
MKIRVACSSDIPQMANLMGQLGYPTSVEQMRKRFEKISAEPSYHTLVIEVEGRVVGMSGLCTGIFYESDGIYVRIVAFVVDDTYRNQGLGKILLAESEKWARSNGADGIVLNSGNRAERMAAHAFYKALGYREKSTGFAKQL